MSHKLSIKAVVFDLDGTILDTFEHIVQAFELVLPRFDVHVEREAIRAVIGKTLHECYATFVPASLVVEAAKLHHQTQQSPEMYALITAYDGLLDCLDNLKALGYKVAVLTNRSRNSVDLIFSHMKLENIFDVVVTADESPAPKPDPRSVKRLSAELSLRPSELLMVGDTHIDVTTAINAGMAASVGVTHGFGEEQELRAAGADYIVHSLGALPDILKGTTLHEV
ncbi:HAD family hydrolase [Candidatus Saccharibacteria bacterium]|nr:HAD family hydrolase [Candidatus Saccharibacteria bacterium]